ncbi:hypothetical protein KR054_005963 [Drosophila jambulina]|nr:hypothetical protein KR054_005963 [Drosophila jambulina]
MCRILSLITIFAVLCLARASVPNTYEETTLCSDRLNDILMMVCETFNGITPQKRGMSKILQRHNVHQKLLDSFLITVVNDLDLLDPVQYMEAMESHPLFRGRFHGGEGSLNSLAPIRRLTRQGIVDRCCKRPCEFSVLREYCSIPRI